MSTPTIYFRRRYEVSPRSQFEAEADHSIHPFTSHKAQDTHGVGRVCDLEGCETKLSRYNPTSRCGPHHGSMLVLQAPKRSRA